MTIDKGRGYKWKKNETALVNLTQTGSTQEEEISVEDLPLWPVGMSARHFFYIANLHRKVPPTVSGALPRWVDMGSLRKGAEQAAESKTVSSIPP